MLTNYDFATCKNIVNHSGVKNFSALLSWNKIAYKNVTLWGWMVRFFFIKPKDIFEVSESHICQIKIAVLLYDVWKIVW